jgi:hypothetical protein
VREIQANRIYGSRFWFWIVFGPWLGRLVVLVAAVSALAWLWVAVPHVYLGGAALAAAAVLGVGWLLWTGSNAALQRRMQARAQDRGRRGVGLGWAVAAAVALLAGTGWLALWSPYA